MPNETREALLDAAELLFEQAGIQATSLRSVTERATANVAAVHYHFGSKEALVRAVVERRLAPINEERVRLLDELEAQGAPSVEEILRVFVEPAMRWGDQGPREKAFLRLLARLHFSADTHLQKELLVGFAAVIERFVDALGRSLPELDEAELLLRLHLAIGAMANMVVNDEILQELSQGRWSALDAESLLAQLLQFVVGGFRAPRTFATAPTVAPSSAVATGAPAATVTR